MRLRPANKLNLLFHNLSIVLLLYAKDRRKSSEMLNFLIKILKKVLRIAIYVGVIGVLVQFGRPESVLFVDFRKRLFWVSFGSSAKKKARKAFNFLAFFG